MPKYKLAKRKGSPYWQITWSERRKPKRIPTGCESREEAEQVFAGFILERTAPKLKQPHEILIETAIEDYLTEHGKNLVKHGFEVARDNARNLKAFFKDQTVAFITRKTVREYVEQRRQKGISDWTIRRELTTLNAALSHAKKEGRLGDYHRAELPPPPPPKERWIDPEEAIEHLNSIKQAHRRIFCEIAYNTGQRPGAILELKWDQVDFSHKVIHFNPPGRRQTSKRRVSVPMSEHLYEVLWEARTVAKSEFVVEYRGKGIKYIRKGFAADCEHAGIEGVTPNILRHTAGTWLAQAGEDMWRIKQLLGHSSIKTTETHYLKHHPAFLTGAVEKLAVNFRGKHLANNSGKNGQKVVKNGQKNAEKSKVQKQGKRAKTLGKEAGAGDEIRTHDFHLGKVIDLLAESKKRH